MPKAPSDDHDSNRTFEVRAPPWMARCRDGLVSPEPRMAGGDLGAWCKLGTVLGASWGRFLTCMLATTNVRWPRMAECPCSQDSNRTFELERSVRLKQGCLESWLRYGWLDSVMARRDLVAAPRLGSLTRRLLIAYVKTSRSCHTASRA